MKNKMSVKDVTITTEVKFRVHDADTTRHCDFCRQRKRRVVQGQNDDNRDICFECIKRLYRLVIKEEKSTK